MQGFIDRLLDAGAGQTLHESVSASLEALLNTRCAMDQASLAVYPEVRASVFNYGLADLASLAYGSDIGRQRACLLIREAIERHEPRLHDVQVRWEVQTGEVNCLRFSIRARLAGGLADFGAALQPSSLRYSITSKRGEHGH